MRTLTIVIALMALAAGTTLVGFAQQGEYSPNVMDICIRIESLGSVVDGIVLEIDQWPDGDAVAWSRRSKIQAHLYAVDAHARLAFVECWLMAIDVGEIPADEALRGGP